MIRILVSILVYNGDDRTIRTISDICGQECDGVNVGIVIIDNCSTNGISDRIAESFPWLKIIRTQSNLGYAGGHNLAIELALKAGVDFLFVLNDDIEIPQSYIQTMVNEGKRHLDAAALGTTICLPDGKIQAVYGYFGPLYAGVKWCNVKSSASHESVKEVDVVQGAAIVLTKKALRRGFKFDEQLFFGCEEYDLGCWAKSESLKIYVLEHIEVIHNTSQKQTVLDRWHLDLFSNYYGTRNSIYIKKKYSRSYLEFVISVAYAFLRSTIKGIVFFFKGYPSFIRYAIKAIYDGLTKRMGMSPDGF